MIGKNYSGFIKNSNIYLLLFLKMYVLSRTKWTRDLEPNRVEKSVVLRCIVGFGLFMQFDYNNKNV